MAIQTLYDEQQDKAALHCTTSGWAFGPTFGPDDAVGLTAAENAEAFLKYASDTGQDDIRALPDAVVERLYKAFLSRPVWSWRYIDDGADAIDGGAVRALSALEAIVAAVEAAGSGHIVDPSDEVRLEDLGDGAFRLLLSQRFHEMIEVRCRGRA